MRPPAGLTATLAPEDRIRATASGVLACWIAFAAAGFGFYKTTEDHPFASAGEAHPLLGGAQVAVQILAVLASIAVLAGALPLLVAAIRQARRARAVRRSGGLGPGCRSAVRHRLGRPGGARPLGPLGLERRRRGGVQRLDPLAADASSLAGAENGPFGAPSVAISISIQLAIMLAAAALATVSTRRGWHALKRA